MNWENWRKHIEAVVSSKGQWVGLADEDGEPITEFPPVESLSAPELKLAAAELQMRVPISSPVHTVVDELVADGLGEMDGEGRLVVSTGPTRMVVVERPGGRSGYFVTHCVAEGGPTAPTMLSVFGVDLMDYLWRHPCPSVPGSWLNNWQTFSEDAAQEYVKPRELNAVEFATRADGYTVKGPADQVIRDLIQDSFDAVNTAMGWADPHLVVDNGGGTTAPEVLIRVADESIGDTISAPASLAGVGVSVSLWWPGDPAVITRDGAQTWSHPVGVVRVEHAEGGE